MCHRRVKSVFVGCLLALVGPAFADSWDVVAHVTEIEPSAVPNVVYFAMDQNAGTCAAGPWSTFPGNQTSNSLPESVKAVYAGLQMALVTGFQIEVYGTSTGCTVTSVHFMNH